LICFSGGDPHFYPFIGGKFDLHHEGIFQTIKYEPAHFEIQQQIVYCRPEQDWSGGLTVKCNAGLAVRIDAENIVETSYKPDFGPPPEGSPAADLDVQLFLNGQPITTMQNLNGIKVTPGELKTGTETTTHVINGPNFAVKIETMSLFLEFTLGLKGAGRNWFGRAPGLCGGGGESQYRLPKRVVGPISGNAAGVENGGENYGYPCQDCVAGIGYVGAICKCHEWLVGPDNQIFQIKSPLPQWKIEQTPVESPAEQAAMSADKQKCSNFVNSLPIGEMAKKITVLASKLAEAIDNCVADKEAGVGGGPRLNRQNIVQNICGEAQLMTRATDPAPELCDLQRQCVHECLDVTQAQATCQHVLVAISDSCAGVKPMAFK